MRRCLGLALVCIFPIAVSAQTPVQPSQVGRPIASIFQSIGVDTHLAYNDGYGMYADYTTLTSALTYLGLTQLRDGLPVNQLSSSSGYVATANMERLSQLGLQFDLIFADYAQPIAYDQANLNSLYAGVGGVDVGPPMMPGAVRIIEGLNEITNEVPAPSLGVATVWQRALLCLTRQASFCPAASVDPRAAGAQVAEFTSNGVLATTTSPSAGFPADSMNVHPYAAPASLPGWSIAQIIAHAFQADYGITPGLAAPATGSPTSAPAPIITESGAFQETFNPARTDGQYRNSYDANTMAIKDLDTLLDGLSIGATTYLYQLFDNYTYDSDNRYGLFSYGGQDAAGHPIAVPTPAATAIHNLTSVMNTPGVVASPTANNCLRYSFANAPADFHSLLVQANNSGAYAIVVWRDDVNDWDVTRHAAVLVTPVPVTLQLLYQASSTVFDPMLSASPVGSAGRSLTVEISVADDPLIVVLQTSNPNDSSCGG